MPFMTKPKSGKWMGHKVWKFKVTAQEMKDLGVKDGTKRVIIPARIVPGLEPRICVYELKTT